MGIYRNENESIYNLMKLRAWWLSQYIIAEQPDILCFQEMSQTFLNFFYKEKIKELYPYSYEQDISNEYLLEHRQKDIEVYIISKIPLKKVTIYPLEGNIDYTNFLGVYEFNNLIVFNVYLQAGSTKSLGQKYK